MNKSRDFVKQSLRQHACNLYRYRDPGRMAGKFFSLSLSRPRTNRIKLSHLIVRQKQQNFVNAPAKMKGGSGPSSINAYDWKRTLNFNCFGRSFELQNDFIGQKCRFSSYWHMLSFKTHCWQICNKKCRRLYYNTF